MTIRSKIDAMIHQARVLKHNGIKQYGLRWAYYKYIYAKKILKTPRIVSNGDEAFELHALGCEKDFMMTLWALKSFYYFSECRPRLILFDDGSLSENSKTTYSEHFPDIRIVARDRFHKDMDTFLGDYETSLNFCHRRSFYCALKFFGPMCYARSKSILYFDSDILFFKKPTELLSLIKKEAHSI